VRTISPPSILAAAAAVLTVTFTVVAGNGFTTGDFYILTFGWPGGPALARIDPVTGATSVLWGIDDLPLDASFTHDPWRDRIVTMPDTNTDVFRLVDARGGVTDLPNPWSHGSGLASFAPTGDGRIYMVTTGLGHFGYIDAANAGHDLYDVDGVTPFFFQYGASFREELIYDEGTNSLFLVYLGQATHVTKIPLSADGTRLAGPTETVLFDAFPDQTDEPMGVSVGPNGTIFIKIDTNTNADGLRMFTVDPVTLAFAPYAYIGHPFVAGNTAGTYNSTYDFAIAMDSGNNVIRSYVESAVVQEGVIFATGVSGGGSGEQTRMITIGDTINGAPPAPCGDTNGDGAADVADLTAVLLAWGVCLSCPEDLNGDGIVDVADLLVVVLTWGACG
jgi:hypothetical protein